MSENKADYNPALSGTHNHGSQLTLEKVSASFIRHIFWCFNTGRWLLQVEMRNGVHEYWPASEKAGRHCKIYLVTRNTEE